MGSEDKISVAVKYQTHRGKSTATVNCNNETTIQDLYDKTAKQLKVPQRDRHLFQIWAECNPAMVPVDGSSTVLRFQKEWPSLWNEIGSTSTGNATNQEMPMKFVFKSAMKLSKKDILAIRTPVTWALLYGEFSKLILDGYIPLSDTEATKFAALRLQLVLGNKADTTKKKGFLAKGDKLSKFVPPGNLPHKEAVDWIKKVWELYSKQDGKNMCDTLAESVNLIASVSLCASIYFVISHDVVKKSSRKDVDSMRVRAALAINCNGLYLMRKNMAIDPPSYDVERRLTFDTVKSVSFSQSVLTICFTNQVEDLVLKSPHGRLLKQILPLYSPNTAAASAPSTPSKDKMTAAPQGGMQNVQNAQVQNIQMNNIQMQNPQMQNMQMGNMQNQQIQNQQMQNQQMQNQQMQNQQMGNMQMQNQQMGNMQMQNMQMQNMQNNMMNMNQGNNMQMPNMNMMQQPNMGQMNMQYGGGNMHQQMIQQQIMMGSLQGPTPNSPMGTTSNVDELLGSMGIDLERTGSPGPQSPSGNSPRPGDDAMAFLNMDSVVPAKNSWGEGK
eukprot:TRINITY_DN4051_c0_g1_i2.p1 TRINITY_DN4051_c0_g1~~TRINITY_DN4051_c0_g1_i2.p1  ORF type:complete len:554 (+),score=159.29 TRINITY_DN4051_c0_g1_i2:112-1773(+)